VTSDPCGLSDALRARFAASPLRIGAGDSTTAEFQTGHVVRLLTTFLPKEVAIEVVFLPLSSDPQDDAPGGLDDENTFSRTVDRALMAKEIDMGIHGLTAAPDGVPLSEGTVFGAYLLWEGISWPELPASVVGIQARTGDAPVMQLLHDLNRHPDAAGRVHGA
jgi:porphobilinogen deaminase